MAAALAGSRQKKKKWNKGKMREKINAKVLFDEDGWLRLRAEVPKVCHPSFLLTKYLFRVSFKTHFLVLPISHNFHGFLADEISYSFSIGRTIEDQLIISTCSMQIFSRGRQDSTSRGTQQATDLHTSQCITPNIIKKKHKKYKYGSVKFLS